MFRPQDLNKEWLLALDGFWALRCFCTRRTDAVAFFVTGAGSSCTRLAKSRDRAIAEGKTASGIRFVWCLFDFLLCLSMTSDSDDESVRRLWEELLALRKVVKDAEADLPNPPCRIRPTTNGTARLRPRRGPRKPRSN
jgi:hypothetical protein